MGGFDGLQQLWVAARRSSDAPDARVLGFLRPCALVIEFSMRSTRVTLNEDLVSLSSLSRLVLV